MRRILLFVFVVTFESFASPTLTEKSAAAVVVAAVVPPAVVVWLLFGNDCTGTNLLLVLRGLPLC